MRRLSKSQLAVLVAASFVLASISIGLLAQVESAQTEPALPVQLAQTTAPTTQQPQKPAEASEVRPAQIDRNGVLILIRTTLLALDQANKSGNYTVLRDLSAPVFQATNTAARPGEIFAWQRNAKLDLAGVAVLDPQLNVLPQIEANGLMRMAGFFPSVPQQIKFEMLFQSVANQWKLFGLAVALGNTAPTAPGQSAPPAQNPPEDAGRNDRALVPLKKK
jgi:hypothetical protein